MRVNDTVPMKKKMSMRAIQKQGYTGLTLRKAKRPGKTGAHKAGGARHYTTGLHTRSDRAISGWPLSLIATSKLVKPLVEEQSSTK